MIWTALLGRLGRNHDQSSSSRKALHYEVAYAASDPKAEAELEFLNSLTCAFFLVY